jgi:hypothetical protein
VARQLGDAVGDPDLGLERDESKWLALATLAVVVAPLFSPQRPRSPLHVSWGGG